MAKCRRKTNSLLIPINIILQSINIILQLIFIEFQLHYNAKTHSNRNTLDMFNGAQLERTYQVKRGQSKARAKH